MIKVCFFSGDITRGGGTERVATMIANELDKQEGYEILFLSLVEQAAELFYPLNENIGHYVLGDRWIQPGPGYIPLIGKVRKFVQKQQIDVLIDIDIVLDILSIPATKNLKTKVVSWEHFNYQFENSVFYRKCILKYSVKHSDYVVTLTERDKESYRKYLGREENIAVIYNPMQERRNQISVEKERWIITTGRLVVGKGLQYLIEMAAHILPEHKDWKWVILGDGDQREYMEKRRKEYGLEEQLILEGMVRDVGEYLEKAAIYVLTSEHEGLPMVLLEAKAYGVPCVSFDINTGPAEIIRDDRDGYLIEPFDCRAMEEKIVKLMKDEMLRQEFSGASQINVDKFSMKAITEKWNEVIRKLCG